MRNVVRGTTLPSPHSREGVAGVVGDGLRAPVPPFDLNAMQPPGLTKFPVPSTYSITISPRTGNVIEQLKLLWEWAPFAPYEAQGREWWIGEEPRGEDSRRHRPRDHVRYPNSNIERNGVMPGRSERITSREPENLMPDSPGPPSKSSMPVYTNGLKQSLIVPLQIRV